MTKTIFDITDTENLISNLRGELGEIIQSWTLLYELRVIIQSLSSDDVIRDSKNQDLSKFYLIKQKIENEIISTLSELAQKKYGQINFYFAVDKLKVCRNEASDFEQFIIHHNFRSKRNDFISHKKLSPTFDEQKAPHRIKYIVILRAIAKALILMKKIDSHFLGSDSNEQWIKIRRKRYEYIWPAKAKYFMLPYIK